MVTQSGWHPAQHPSPRTRVSITGEAISHTYLHYVFIVSTVCGLIQCACTKSLQKSSGLWAHFSPWRWRETISHSLILQNILQKSRKEFREQQLFMVNFPLLPPEASDWQTKERTTICTEALQKITCWEERKQVPGPSQPGKVGAHTHRFPQSELVPGGSRRGKQIWDPASLSGTEELWILSFAFRRTYWPWVFLTMTDCCEMHKQCTRRLSWLQKATYYRKYFVAVCKEVKNHIRTNCRLWTTCAQQDWGFYALGLTFYSFYSYHMSAGSNIHFIASVVSQFTQPFYLQGTNWHPEISPKIWPKSLSLV